MANYKAYPEYKDSGVEWLGEIPGHWKINKLRYMFNFGKGLTITKENLQDEGIPCINYGEVHSKYGFEVSPKLHPLKCVDEKYLKDNSGSLLSKGDIIFADTSEDMDGSGNFSQLISDDIVFAGYHTIIAKPFNRKNWRFYAYLLDCKEVRTQVRHAVKGVKVFSITQAILRGLSIWLPTEDEQEKIATFLDHETAKIDNLIEKQQQLIELLKEKCQAVISHAVTKGLNPDVPMKDSGVEWLGEVPEHWSMLQLKHIFRIKKRIAGKIGYDVLSVTQKGIKIKDITSNEGQLSMDYSKYQRVLPGDFAMNHMDLLTGYIDISSFDGVTSPDYRVFSVINGDFFYGYYYLYLLQNGYHQKLFFHLGQGSSHLGRWRLPTEAFNEILYPCPSLGEQIKIVDFLHNQTTKIDTLIEKQLQQIELLQERRTALISAAVTGKIDVRSWHAPAAKTATPAEASA
ncbi:restriction endonuclease subunit S [Salmonella enterica subsp. salamae]|nr:restriction endonuclease subunit S [Salmonella enterica subsp. salamae]ECJ2282734.1 restriction endonuclease subunit S [Salmonella enterica subsp. salamae]HCC0887520.1 restriction endonuclease subunit S [Salmonella enterica]